MLKEAELLAAAIAVRQRAHAPWSQFFVGAAVQMGSGRIYAGCNVESASFSLTCCAERVALFKAISEGESELVGAVVVSDTDPAAGPCGACRQVLYEFGPRAEILMADLQGVQRRATLQQLLPGGFGPEDLRRGQKRIGVTT